MKYLFLVLCLFSSYCFSADTTEITVGGKIISFDEKVVVLKQKSGATVKIPRSSLKQKKGIRVGQDILELHVQPVDFIRLNPDILKKPKAQ
ncbi:MAG: hypothetical protein H6623_05665 [Bdellovibrionaceae bacterium]|nr:hypothetical protein [Pseudobdellovibrionaceae bacterium]